MVVDITNDITFEQLADQLSDGSNTKELLESILTADPAILPAELTPVEFLCQCGRAAKKAQDAENEAQGYQQGDRIAAYSDNGNGSLRSNDNKRFIEESVTITARNYVGSSLVAQNK